MLWRLISPPIAFVVRHGCRVLQLSPSPSKREFWLHVLWWSSVAETIPMLLSTAFSTISTILFVWLDLLYWLFTCFRTTCLPISHMLNSFVHDNLCVLGSVWSWKLLVAKMLLCPITIVLIVNSSFHCQQLLCTFKNNYGVLNLFFTLCMPRICWKSDNNYAVLF